MLNLSVSKRIAGLLLGLLLAIFLPASLGGMPSLTQAQEVSSGGSAVVYLPAVSLGAGQSNSGLMPGSPTHTATVVDTPVLTPTATHTPTTVPTNTPMPTPTATYTPTTVPTDTPMPTPTATYMPTTVPTDTPMPTPTATYTPTTVPTDTPMPTPTVQTATDWLSYTNYYRSLGQLPPVSERLAWTKGAYKHAIYMVKNDYIGHTEDVHNEWYTLQGLAAAQASNVAASRDVSRGHQYALDSWMQAPFHALGILDPHLRQVGYGAYSDADGGYQMAAAFDVVRGRSTSPPSVQFPIKWPADGMTVPLRLHWGEDPNPLTSCPGYSAPAGLPIILQVGPGNLIPTVTAHSFTRGGTPLEHCLFDETSYVNPDANQQSLGRGILDDRDAVVIIPRDALEPGEHYTVSVSIDGTTHTWSFSVSDETTQSSIEIPASEAP